jgi:hypothetical protein
MKPGIAWGVARQKADWPTGPYDLNRRGLAGLQFAVKLG